MVCSSQLSPRVYINLTVVASQEWSSNKGRVLIWFLTYIQGLALPSGATEEFVPLS
jgi:hypothetical protein